MTMTTRRSLRFLATPALAALLALSPSLSSCAQHAPPSGGQSTAASVSMVPVAPVAASPNAPEKQAWNDSEEKPKAPFDDGARTFEALKKKLLETYVDAAITDDELYRAAAQGMLEHLDPKLHKWNKLLTPDELAALRSDLSSEIVGIGVHIEFDPASGYVDVRGIIPGSPAEKAGLMAGDKVITIDGKLFKGAREEDVVARVRGKAGEVVNLLVLRADKLQTFAVTRALVRYDDVKSRVLPGGVGYVQVHQFGDKTPAAFRAALEESAKRGDVALVLDLRDNQGGSFEAAVACAEMLLPKGTGIVTLKKRAGDEVFTAKGAQLLPNVPLAILVSHQTASGAELVSAALQEGRHARVVGAQTFGKWTVQELETLPNGYAAKYTLGLFRTPSGRSFEGVGLAPDVEVDMNERDRANSCSLGDASEFVAHDVQLRTAVTLLHSTP